MKDLDRLLNKMLINPDMSLEDLREYCESADDVQLVYEEYDKLVRRKFDEAQGIYRFIDLYNRAEYLKKIGYEFSPIEQAYFIYHSRRTDLSEKHEAWRKIQFSPDTYCDFHGLDDKDHTIKLSALLEGYMAYQDDILARLGLKKEGTYYYSGYVAFERRDEQVEDKIRKFLAQKVYRDNFVKLIEIRTLPYTNDDCTIYVTNREGKVTEVMTHKRTEAAKAFDRLHVSLPDRDDIEMDDGGYCIKNSITEDEIDRIIEELWDVLERLK